MSQTLIENGSIKICKFIKYVVNCHPKYQDYINYGEILIRECVDRTHLNVECRGIREK